MWRGAADDRLRSLSEVCETLGVPIVRVSLRLKAEELRVRYWGCPATRARAVLYELLDTGRVPPKVPLAPKAGTIAVARRLWISLEPRPPEGAYLVVIWDDQCWIRAVGFSDGALDRRWGIERRPAR